MGHLAVMDDKPMRDDTCLLSIFKIFAARAGAELERKRVEEALQRANDELEIRVEKRTTELLNEISGRKKAEAKGSDLRAKLIQAEKLSSLGLMAAGVAHELNNPLTGMLSLIRTYLRRKEEGDEDYNDLCEMLEASNHMAKIVEDLNSFSRVSEGDLREIDLKSVIESTLSFSTKQLKYKNIQIKKKYTEDLPKIKGNKPHLQQVVLNLLTNCQDAMPDGGELTISTSYSKDRKTVFFAFEDEGKGIKKEDVGKIFDPFFTTKAIGEGVGLGLSVMHGIIQAHQGEIFVETQEGKGTKINIALPAFD